LSQTTIVQSVKVAQDLPFIAVAICSEIHATKCVLFHLVQPPLMCCVPSYLLKKNCHDLNGTGTGLDWNLNGTNLSKKHLHLPKEYLEQSRVGLGAKLFI
jgi:hypothetical protein